MGYSKIELLSLRSTGSKNRVKKSGLLTDLRKLGICRNATIRGCRGSGHGNAISTIIQNEHALNGMNRNNLMNTNNLIPIVLNGPLDNPIESIVTMTTTNIIHNTSSKTNNHNLTRIKCVGTEGPKLKHLNFACVNVRSLKNKVLDVTDYVVENEIDLLAITETWLFSDDSKNQVTLASILIPGYKFIHMPRTTGKGGGVGLLYRTTIDVKILNDMSHYVSFEQLSAEISIHGKSVNLICVYRPPPNHKNKFTFPQFQDEFCNLVDKLILNPSKLIIAGDFNLHMEVPDDPVACEFNSLMDSYGLSQHVPLKATHIKGHTLDLIITRGDDNTISECTIDGNNIIADHFWINCSLNLQKPPLPKKSISFRKIKNIDHDLFRNELKHSLEHVSHLDCVDTMVDEYNSVLSQSLNKHAPEKTRVITLHPLAEWYDDDITKAKQERRKAERLRRSTGLTVHEDLFIQARDKVSFMINQAKRDFYTNIIKNSSDSKDLFKVVGCLTAPTSIALPKHESPKVLADKFSKYFTEKIEKIRSEFPTNPTCDDSDEVQQPPKHELSHFEHATEDEIKKIVTGAKSTTCKQDPLPTNLLKKSLASLLTVITAIVNASFDFAKMPSSLKKASVIPLLKKPTLDTEILKNYRPVSNLSFLSKIIERVVASRLKSFMDKHGLHEYFQSAYKCKHSTETALLRVQNDLLQAVGSGSYAVLILLDLSAAFDTIDHKVLISRLLEKFGIKGQALAWIKSYLEQRFQEVIINGSLSELCELLFGVPQGSVLGPLLFIMYTTPLGDIIRKHGFSFHCYADDTQIYVSFHSGNMSATLVRLQSCIADIKDWMTSNFLRLNDDKTEMLLIGTKNMMTKLSQISLEMGDINIMSVSEVRNLGAMFDSTLNMKGHIDQVCRGSWFHLRRIGQIRNILDTDSTKKVIHAFVTSRLDNLNSLLYKIPELHLKKLRRVQYAAARMVLLSKERRVMLPLLKQLHWLPVSKRIEYKILILTYKSLNNLGPKYLSDLLQIRSSSHGMALRSNQQLLLEIPHFSKLPSFGDRSFSVAAPTLWNNLPVKLRVIDSPLEFKSKLKTHLFSIAFKDI